MTNDDNMINNYVSIDRVINEIIRNLGLAKNQEIPYQDIIEWAYEALVDIGAYAQFVEQEVILTVCDYKAKLPCDLYKVKKLGVCYNYDYTDRSETKILTILDGLSIDLDDLSDAQIDKVRRVALQERTPTQQLTDLMYNSYLAGNIPKNRHGEYDYNITNGQILVGFRNGYLTLQYIALPVDERGFPKVPDDTAFSRAILYKCGYYLCMRGFQFANPQLQDINWWSFKWERYCGQARGRANMPDQDMYERIMNIVKRPLKQYNVSSGPYEHSPQNWDFDKSDERIN